MGNVQKQNTEIITTISDILKFINEEYTKTMASNIEGIHALYLFRVGNTIRYGIQEDGRKYQKDTAKVVIDDNLEEIYKFIKQQHEEEFKLMTSHSFDGKYTLIPIINEKLWIFFESTESYDQNWFYKEANNRNRN